MEKEKIEDDLTYKIIGCAMHVHATLGNGFQEVIYQRALAIAMEKAGLGFARELEVQIYYEGVEIGTRRVDFLVENNIMVELKALTKMEDRPKEYFRLNINELATQKNIYYTS